MSWTVQQDDTGALRGPATIPDANLEEILQKVVDDDDDDEKPSPFKKGTSGSTGNSANTGGNQLRNSATTSAYGSMYTKSSQVFSPPPLTPSDLQATPVKDPLESFNSWVRTQTPTSSRNSPTPNGAGLPVSSPPSAQRQGGMSTLQPNATPFLGTTTPQKFNNTTNLSVDFGGSPNGGVGQQRSRPQLETILEHRKQLMLQMEELALQELELRQHGGSGSTQQNANMMSATPHASSGNFGAQLGGSGIGAGYGSMGTFPEWSPSAGGVAPSPYQNHQNQGMMSAFSNGITAENIRGRVYETAKDQHGCRFLQRWLDTNYDGEAVQVIMSEIIPHVAELMTDQYANFLVQKLFDIMPHDVRYNVAQVAAPHIAHIALTPHGTFSVQKLIETIATREEMEVIRESLSHDVVRLVKDVHGNHVIQKVLQRFEHPDKEFIYEAVSTDCAAIATNKQGCCVLQRCLEFASPAQHKALVACILQVCLQIVQDPFGNYVLQYVLEANEPGVNDVIAKAFLPHLVPLCMNKFSSNVMEKVLRGATLPVREMYVEHMRNAEIVASLMQDDFGNYVLQTALTMTSTAQAETLVAVIRPLMPMIKNAPYAKKLEAKMDLIMKKKSTVHTGPGGNGPTGPRGYGVTRGPASHHQGNGPMSPTADFDVSHGHHHHHHHHHHAGNRGGANSGFSGGAQRGGYRGNGQQHGGPQHGGWQPQ
jgi:hypothetical protein